MRMQKYSRLIPLLLLVLAAVSCGKDNQESLIAFNLDDAVRTDVDSIVESVEVIPLEMGGDRYPYGINRLYTSEENFVVVDNKNVIFVYSADGRFISDSFRRMGKGEGEYDIVTGVAYDSHGGYIMIATPMKLLTYDSRFNFVDKSDLPTRFPKKGYDGLFFQHIRVVSPSEYILIPGSSFDDSCQVIMYDTELKEITGEFKYRDDILSESTMQTEYFYELSDGRLLFFPPGICHYIYSFDPATKEFSKKYRIDFGKNGISEADLDFGTDREKERKFVMNTDKNVPLKTMKSGDNMVIMTKTGNSVRQFHTYVWNLKSGSKYVIDSYKDGKLTFPPIYCTDDSGIYCVVDSENISDIYSRINPDKVRFPEYEITEGSIVVLKYVLKSFQVIPH